ncbi:MAG: hypothetical protein [Podoviridae sp. ctg2L5]|nr:MAG: hypothetical protein [Podoviridae sp. ctg2L5]
MARSKFEIKAQKELEKEGYIVDWKLRPRFKNSHYNTDYFNLFDLLAYKANEPVRFISIKGTMGVLKQHRQEIEKFKATGIKKEAWWYRKLKGSNKFVRKIIPLD